MRIGIDVDDTITDTYPLLLAFIAKEYNLDLDALLESKPSYGVLKKTLPNYREFARNNLENVAKNVKLKSDVVEYLEKLKQDGHEIIFITARTYRDYSNPFELTYKYLKDNGVPFDKLVVDIKDKGTECLKENIDIFIDDDNGNCESIMKAGIPCLQFHVCFNLMTKGTKKVYSWKEVYDYINDLKRK